MFSQFEVTREDAVVTWSVTKCCLSIHLELRTATEKQQSTWLSNQDANWAPP
jgi:hypothetical protein